jgi:hypothetical protein
MFGFFVLMNKLSNLTAWILNSDATPVEGYSYIWDDSAIWDDDAIWKD